MRFAQLQQRVGHLPWFDLAMVTQSVGEPRRSLVNQLSRWVREERVLSLRRGMYALAEPFRRGRLAGPSLANALYTPSYLSGAWVLGYYGLIPEAVFTYTSVTTRVPRHFENAVGVFAYGHLDRRFFWGYGRREVDGDSVLIASPEKALLDYWHLHLGEWTDHRVREMRFQQTGLVDPGELTRGALRFGLPRLQRAVAAFLRVSAEDAEGEAIL